MNLRKFLILFVLMGVLAGTPVTHSQDPTPSPTPVASPTESPEEASPSPSPTPSLVNRVELHQALLDLTNLSTVMCVAAHPDDEDGTTLTVLRRKYGIHTVSLFSTYGEGGQNAVGPELYEDLGVIRAQETLKAAQIQGSEAHFLGLKDFGFSKSADEAFKIWGHDEALKRMVLKIRELRPDVIITNHDTTSGHGHHQATGRLLLEAFEAAADPQRFSEQLKLRGPHERPVSTWQVKRLFVRARRTTGSNPTTTEKLVVVDPNEVDPLRQTSYGEQALTALQHHASQGPWPKSIGDWLRAQNNQTGKLNLIRYRLEAQAPNVKTLPANAATFVDEIAFPEFVASLLAPALGDASPLKLPIDQTEPILDRLIDWGLRNPPVVPEGETHRAQLFQDRLSKALAIAAGLTLNLISSSQVLVPGATDQFTVTLANTGSRIVRVHRASLDVWVEKIRLDAAEHLLPDTETSITVERGTPKTAAITVPHRDHLYDVLLYGKRLIAEADLGLDGARLLLTTELNLDVAPAIEIKSITPEPYVWTPATAGRPLTLNVLLENHTAQSYRGLLKLKSPTHNIYEFGQELSLGPNESRTVTLQPGAAVGGSTKRSRSVSALATVSIGDVASSLPLAQRAITINFSNAVVARGRRVGYLPSFDQTLENALDALSVESKKMAAEDFQSGDLSLYDTIIIDNRGYEAHPELIAANSRLLEYVQTGGTLIVFYHKDDEWNPNEKQGRPQLAPYPIVLGNERVTDETAPIKFLVPGHPLLRYPNVITQTDFNNWIQERGLYYPKEWDAKYSALLSTNDPGENALQGGLLLAKYGRGNYIYTSMVWYRQLRAGIPGGYRMFANMISYGPKRARQTTTSSAEGFRRGFLRVSSVPLRLCGR